MLPALARYQAGKTRLDRARPGADKLGEKQFAAALSGADGLRQQLIQADEHSGGRIGRDEWLRWFGPALGEQAELADAHTVPLPRVPGSVLGMRLSALD